MVNNLSVTLTRKFDQFVNNLAMFKLYLICTYKTLDRVTDINYDTLLDV